MSDLISLRANWQEDRLILCVAVVGDIYPEMVRLALRALRTRAAFKGIGHKSFYEHETRIFGLTA